MGFVERVSTSISTIRRFIVLLALISLASLASLSVFAQAEPTFSIRVTPSLKSIDVGETALYKLQVIHNKPDQKTFEVFTPDVMWDVRPGKTLIVPPGIDGLVAELYIRPLHETPGIFGIPIIVQLAGTQRQERTIANLELVSLFAPEIAYRPALRGSVSLPESFVPGEPIKITVKIENQNRIDHERIAIKFRSDLINRDEEISLGPLKQDIVAFELTLDEKTPPQSDLLRTTLFAFDEDKSYQFDLIPVPYSVLAWGEIAQGETVQRTFLGSIRTIRLTNVGNVRRMARYVFDSNLLLNLFIKTTPKSARENGDHVWVQPLQAGESPTITITSNYWPLYVIALLAAIIVAGYYLFRSPLLLKKRATMLSAREGGISELRITVSVQNRGKKDLRKIRVIDLVPRIAKISRESELGSVSPHKVIQHERKGQIIHWHVDKLEPGEERMISYRIRSELSILGELELPSVMAKFEPEPHVSRTTRSGGRASVGF